MDSSLYIGQLKPNQVITYLAVFHNPDRICLPYSYYSPSVVPPGVIPKWKTGEASPPKAATLPSPPKAVTPTPTPTPNNSSFLGVFSIILLSFFRGFF